MVSSLPHIGPLHQDLLALSFYVHSYFLQPASFAVHGAHRYAVPISALFFHSAAPLTCHPFLCVLISIYYKPEAPNSNSLLQIAPCLHLLSSLKTP